MRTLEEFQKEVLAPLRKERDKKHEVALKIKTDGGEAFAKRKKELLDKEVEFKERQKSSLKEFLGKQTLGKKSFFSKVLIVPKLMPNIRKLSKTTRLLNAVLTKSLWIS